MERNLKKVTPSKEERKEEQLANSIRKSAIDFYKLGIKQGDEFTYTHNSNIKVKVLDNRNVEYNGEKTSLSALAQKLLGKRSPIQGTLHFSYNGEILKDLRDRLENENNAE